MIAYLAVTDKDHNTTVRWHIVWDAERFIDAQRVMYAEEKATVAVITEEEYRRQHWPNYQGATP